MRIWTAVLYFVMLPVCADPIVIGNTDDVALDTITLQRIYTGKIVEMNGMRVTPINLPSGHVVRAQFLRDYLKQDEDKYVGYWTVRRYIGKGTPPRELDDVTAIIQFVAKNRGAIGYVDTTELPQNIKILLHRAQ